MKLGRISKYLPASDFIQSELEWFYVPERILFIILKPQAFIDPELIQKYWKNKKIGFISTTLSKSEKENLKANSISFIIPDKEAVLFQKDAVYQITLKGEKEEATFPYTKFISPSGLAILDTLLKFDPINLRNMTSAGFCKKFNLSPAKMSNMLKASDSKTIMSLHEWLLEKDIDWWTEAFKDVKANRVLKPFDVDRIYVSTKKAPPLEILNNMRMSPDWNRNITLSGIEFLKENKLITDNSIHISVRKSYESELFKKFHLVPAAKNLLMTIFKITLFSKDFDEQSMFSHIHPEEKEFNILRMLWGIQTPDDRIQEVRFNFLERYLNEIKRRI